MSERIATDGIPVERAMELVAAHAERDLLRQKCEVLERLAESLTALADVRNYGTMYWGAAKAKEDAARIELAALDKRLKGE